MIEAAIDYQLYRTDKTKEEILSALNNYKTVIVNFQDQQESVKILITGYIQNDQIIGLTVDGSPSLVAEEDDEYFYLRIFVGPFVDDPQQPSQLAI